MEPAIGNLMFAWYIWGLIFVGTALMTIIGTYLITRGWEE